MAASGAGSHGEFLDQQLWLTGSGKAVNPQPVPPHARSERALAGGGIRFAWGVCLAAGVMLPGALPAQQPIASTSVHLYSAHLEGNSSVRNFSAFGSGRYLLIESASRMRTLLYAAQIYAVMNGDRFPNNASTLFNSLYWPEEGGPDACAFHNPGDLDPVPTTINNDVLNAPNSAQISFEYLAAGQPADGSPTRPVFRDNSAANNAGLGRWAAYADGHVVFEPANPHPFTMLHTELGLCGDFTIVRGPSGSQEPYDLLSALPGDANLEIDASLGEFDILAEGSISPGILNVFATEGFDQDNYVLYGGTWYATADNAQVTGPPGAAQRLTAYVGFDGTLALPLEHIYDSANLGFTLRWSDFQGDSLTDYHVVALTHFGVVWFGKPAFCDVTELHPGDAGYVPGTRTVRLNGVMQLSLEVPVNQDGYTYLSVYTSGKQEVNPATPPGDFMHFTVHGQLPLTAAEDQVKLYLPAGYQLDVSGSSGIDDGFRSCLRGDYDLDGEVDSQDRAVFDSSFSGPHGAPGYTAPGFQFAQTFDFDGDGDIDCDDYEAFTAAWTASGQAPPLARCQTLYSVTTNVQGAGAVTLDPPPGPYYPGTPVRLAAAPAEGWQFVMWEGDASGSDPITTIYATANKNVTAVFASDCSVQSLPLSFCQEPAPDPIDNLTFVPIGTTLGFMRAAESFTLGETTAIEGIKCWGTDVSFVGQPCGEVLSQTFVVMIYEDVGGLPAPPVELYVIVNGVDRRPTGRWMPYIYSLVTLPEYVYTLPLTSPFVAQAGQTYWIEIAASTTALDGTECFWLWALSAEGDGSSVYNNTPGATSYSAEDVFDYDLAVCLLQEEPTTADCNGNTLDDACEIAGGLAEDCNNNSKPDECDLTDGTSQDCNGNLTPDECDLTDGTSQDCNGNLTPDECDLTDGTSQDCNDNLTPDECDLTDGTSQDCNGNLTPDECDLTDGTSADCNGNLTPDECDLTDGTSQDCNNNLTPDECDVTAGTSEDCNDNLTPDECDLTDGTSQDCNNNVTPDECDVTAGTSEDCNGNLIPDECDLTDGASQDCNGNLTPDECDIAGGSADCNSDDVPDECQLAGNDCNADGILDACQQVQPAITQHPASLTRTVGQSASFSVATTGYNPTYQWQRNGTDIAGAVQPTYTIPSVNFSHDGEYRAKVMSPCGTVYSNPATLTVNGVQNTLTVIVQGQGSVELSPPGGVYNAGTVVRLTPLPAPGWHFSNWSGDASGAAWPILISMADNRTVTAVFAANEAGEVRLSVQVVGQGSVVATPPGGAYSTGTQVQLQAAPAEGWQFDYWEGDAAGSDSIILLQMSADRSVTAVFSELPPAPPPATQPPGDQQQVDNPAPDGSEACGSCGLGIAPASILSLLILAPLRRSRTRLRR